MQEDTPNNLPTSLGSTYDETQHVVSTAPPEKQTGVEEEVKLARGTVVRPSISHRRSPPAKASHSHTQNVMQDRACREKSVKIFGVATKQNMSVKII